MFAPAESLPSPATLIYNVVILVVFSGTAADQLEMLKGRLLVYCFNLGRLNHKSLTLTLEFLMRKIDFQTIKSKVT